MEKPMKFNPVPYEIEAIQFTGENLSSIRKFCTVLIEQKHALPLVPISEYMKLPVQVK